MPPRILIFGLPRTGTQSLCDAITLLTGEPVYHMREVATHCHQPAWISLLDRKYRDHEGPEALIPALKVVLEPYCGMADFPASIFAESLLSAYPDAKVILTPRQEDAWFKSMLRTLWAGHLAATAETDDRNVTMRGLRWKYHEYCWGNDFSAKGREYYRRYVEEVKGLCEGREVLEWDVGGGMGKGGGEEVGWERLCGFLGCDVPVGRAFPGTDEYDGKPVGGEQAGTEGEVK
ncbi:hypothetical protein B0A48_17530 [Cryoendolithus antarcticus]|uniref:Sulfotransferase domain-containing protein n=1 Tax=Cryoendolithus antarcticus TaxID=1507870 RepID=A0A1V8SB82_9PEZI|nr:hypothetical protein B0A48_17530 [Cryoendolithus antarcticus]